MKKLLRKISPPWAKFVYHRAIALIASLIYPLDQARIKIIGVTGTDGKTTTTFYLEKIFEEAGFKVACINGIHFKIGEKEWKNDTDNTTPGPFALRKFVSQAIAEKCPILIIEATSWGLCQWRVWGIDFDAAVITNVTYEHLDLHKTFEKYQQAKGQLFAMTAGSKRKKDVPKLAVVNMDDPSNEFFLNFRVDKRVTYGVETNADLRAANIKAGAGKVKFDLVAETFNQPVILKLPGLFNVYNAMAALAVAWGWGIELEKIIAGLEKLEYIPGRMEMIDEGQPFGVIVDFAHTPNGMRQLFQTARGMFADGRVIAVYGATGGRDKGKRPMIGEVAGELVDFSVLTSEDPRNEHPAIIAEQIIVGLKKKGREPGKDFIFILDRAEAIEQAVKMARPGDVVLLCSMGCYDCMYVGDGKIPWDDRVAAHQALHTAGYKVG